MFAAMMANHNHEEGKRALIRNLSSSYYVKLAPSRIHGVGVVAVRDIPRGVDPFELSSSIQAPPTIDLSPSEVAGLPDHVQQHVRQFVLPHSVNNSKYFALPEGGVNAFDVSFYVNCSDSKKSANLALTDGTDKRGFTRFKTIKDVPAGEELTAFYYERSAIRTKGEVHADTGALIDALPGCRICQEPVGVLGGERCISTGCECSDKKMHTQCAFDWYDRKVRIEVHQDNMDGSGGWQLRPRVQCEVCQADLSDSFLQALLTSEKTSNAVRSLGLCMDTSATKLVMLSVTAQREDTRPRQSHSSSRLRSACGKRQEGARDNCSSSRARDNSSSNRARPRKCALTFVGQHLHRRWETGTAVRIWMEEDGDWVAGQVLSFVTAAQRNRKARRAEQRKGSKCTPPQHERGAYRIQWPYTDDPDEFDCDYFSEGDTTVQELVA